MERKSSLTLLIAFAITSVFATASLALFTDSAPVDGNTIDTGTLDIAASPAIAALTLSNMFPGDSVTGSIVVSNSGTGELRYSMSSTVTETVLSGELSLKIKYGLTTCDEASMNDPAQGTAVYDGVLSGAGFGDITPGTQTGDRTLASGTSETLCLQAALPLTSGNSFQGLSTTATFTFDAEQTKNNA